MEKWYLYYILEQEGGSPVWVGVSKNPEKRFLAHIYPDGKEPNKSKLFWARSLKGRGVVPILKIIDSFDSKKEAVVVEAEHTRRFRKVANLLNIYDGCYHDDATRIKNSIRNTGKKHSHETKEKIRKYFSQPEFAENARMAGMKTCKKIMDNNGVVYQSISDAARVTGVHRVSIGMNLRGKFKQIKGYRFQYV